MPKAQPPKRPKVDIKDLERQVTELTEALQRERADAVNIRRRSEEERAAMGNFYKIMVVRELLPVIDNLERALRHTPKELADSDYLKGIEGVARQFAKVLGDLGVERIKTVGEAFDPKYHEAISMDDGQGTREVVSEELQAGYRLGNEVIRHAMVKVRMEE